MDEILHIPQERETESLPARLRAKAQAASTALRAGVVRFQHWSGAATAGGRRLVSPFPFLAVAADVGVAGKDILLEYHPDVYELLDLNVGRCKMAVAAPRAFRDDGERTLRVATKFASIAADYYAGMGRDVDFIKLNGSIELAPILGLSDVIVDIVETGTTLRENDLEVVADILPISARLIANKASFKFKNRQLEEMLARMKEQVK